MAVIFGVNNVKINCKFISFNYEWNKSSYWYTPRFVVKYCKIPQKNRIYNKTNHLRGGGHPFESQITGVITSQFSRSLIMNKLLDFSQH